VPQTWQEIDARWHPCHWWQDVARRMITAMGILIEILAISVFFLVVGVGAYLGDYIRDDGYRRSARRTPPRSHYSDPFDPRSRMA